MAKQTIKYSVEDSIKLLEALKQIRDAHALLYNLYNKYGVDSKLASDELEEQMYTLVREIQELTIKRQREKINEAMKQFMTKILQE